MTIYSPLKVFHHRERLHQLRQGKQPVPCQVHLVISDLCNQDCNFCAYRASGYSSNQLFVGESELASYGHNNPKRVIPYGKIVEILDDCVNMGIPAIQITGGGEPTVHPHFSDVIESVLSRRLELALVTNGLLIDKHIDQLVHAKWIRVSIDAGTEGTYSEVRNVGTSQWTKVWSNLEKLVRDKIKYGTHAVIGVGFVVTKDNYLEIYQCANRAKEVGVDNIRISAVFQTEGEGYFHDLYPTAKTLIHQAKTLEDDRFKVFDLFGDRVEDLKQHSPEYEFCGIQNFVTYIGGDQNVYRCCVLAYNEQGKIGSIKDQRFRDLWRSLEKQQKFNNFDARKCPACMFNNKNRTILYAIDPEPEHVNYV